MVSLMQLWMPIVLSAVFVFIASALINMFLKFWHTPDYLGFSNEDEVRAAVRKGAAKPGMYNLPYCTMENSRSPEMQQKFVEGPIGLVMLRPSGPMNLGKSLGQWFVFCLVVSVLVALIAIALPANESAHAIFHVTALAALLGHALGAVPNAIWWGQPGRVAVKYFVDGFLYALITGFTFEWLWPH